MTSTQANGSTALAVRTSNDDHALAPTEVVAPMSWSDIMQMGNELVRTGFLPDQVKTGAQAAAIILAAREMGIPPMKAFRTLYIYKGKIDEYADSQLARFKGKGGRSQFRELTATRAVLWLRHPNGDEHVEEFTIEDAQKAELTGSNANYKKNPKSMLRSRAITNGLKSLGWEDAVGSYDPSEIDTFAHEPVPHPGTTVTTTVKATEYKPDATRKAKVEALMNDLGIVDGRGSYYREVAGGALPASNDETDAAIAELETRVAEKKAREARAQSDGKDDAGADG